MKTLTLTSGTNPATEGCFPCRFQGPKYRFSGLMRDKAQLRGSVCYKTVTVALTATGSKAAQFSATGSVVADTGPKHTSLFPGWRRQEQLITCLPTREPLQHSHPIKDKVGGDIVIRILFDSTTEGIDIRDHYPWHSNLVDI